MPSSPSPSPSRRAFVAYFGSIGLGSTLLPGVLWAKVAGGAEINKETIAAAAEIAGLRFGDNDLEMMVTGLRAQERRIRALHAVPLANAVPPAVQFDPLLPGTIVETERRPMVRAPVSARAAPASIEELAFAPVTELSELVRRRKITSTQLTKMYLERLEKHDPTLKCVVTLTPDRALERARTADEEIARGKYRGALHGIPWGVKDLLSVKGYPTTWGTAPFRNQMFDEDATVVQRLDAAGAVLVAKLTVGELAMGDVWFGGMTRNPWMLDQGSSGSSAGSASATSAGLVGFAIGTETLGSISSPSTRCGSTGLRPTYGRVPRTGAMALSWSMDKIGPICRSVEDCALVLDAIHGADGRDAAARDAAFNWDARVKPSALRVGYLKSAFDRERPGKAFDDAALEVLRELGARLTPVELPDMPYDAMRFILVAEAAAAFDDLTRSGRDREMAQQGHDAWPNTFRVARFIPAVDYVNANRLRTLAMRAMAKLMSTLDVLVAPTAGAQLLVTNLTGHPALILPNGFRDDGTPVSLTFLGDLYREATILALAHAYQERTGFHRKHPVL
jgi:Asp-tRNA(Asn)/Glu-tRNA(Gln) amidotransferase A subunit family amidase